MLPGCTLLPIVTCEGRRLTWRSQRAPIIWEAATEFQRFSDSGALGIVTEGERARAFVGMQAPWIRPSAIALTPGAKGIRSILQRRACDRHAHQAIKNI